MCPNLIRELSSPVVSAMNRLHKLPRAIEIPEGVPDRDIFLPGLAVSLPPPHLTCGYHRTVSSPPPHTFCYYWSCWMAHRVSPAHQCLASASPAAPAPAQGLLGGAAAAGESSEAGRSGGSSDGTGQSAPVGRYAESALRDAGVQK